MPTTNKVHETENPALSGEQNPNPTPTPPSPVIPSELVKNPDGTVNYGASAVAVGQQRTGTGLGAAQDSKYAWNKSADEIAGLKMQSDVLTAQTKALKSAAEINRQASQGQESIIASKYGTNQTIEKYGWTGGSALDADLQVEYLKSSIQADMFAQVRLQEKGLDNDLAAARLAFSENQKVLAMQHYDRAFQKSIEMERLTGRWFSPEVTDMMSQYSFAQQILGDDNATPADRAQAERLLGSIDEWFITNGLSKSGVVTLNALTTLANFEKADMERKLMDGQIQNLIAEGLLNEISAFAAIQSTKKDEAGVFNIAQYNDNGNLIGYSQLNMDEIGEELINHYIESPFSLREALQVSVDQQVAAWMASDSYEKEGKTTQADYADYLAENGYAMQKYFDRLKAAGMTDEEINSILGTDQASYIANAYQAVNNAATIRDNPAKGAFDNPEKTIDEIYKENNVTPFTEFMTTYNTEKAKIDSNVASTYESKVKEEFDLINNMLTNYKNLLAAEDVPPDVTAELNKWIGELETIKQEFINRQIEPARDNTPAATEIATYVSSSGGSSKLDGIYIKETTGGLKGTGGINQNFHIEIFNSNTGEMMKLEVERGAMFQNYFDFMSGGYKEWQSKHQSFIDSLSNGQIAIVNMNGIEKWNGSNNSTEDKVMVIKLNGQIYPIEATGGSGRQDFNNMADFLGYGNTLAFYDTSKAKKE